MQVFEKEIHALSRRFLETDVGFVLDSVSHIWGDPSQSNRSETLADLLYQQVYTRKLEATVSSNIEQLPRHYSCTLDQANYGKGWQLQGFTVRGCSGSNYLLRAPCGTVYSAKPDEIISSKECIGTSMAIPMGKGDFTSSSGFYIASGDTFAGNFNGGVIRYYWNIRSSALGPLLMREITTTLNTANLSFRFKVASSKFGLGRRDTAVLYISKQEFSRFEIEQILNFTSLYEHMLDDDPPLFTNRVQYGVFSAKDPGTGKSFGQHVCSIIATALLSQSSPFKPVDGNNLWKSILAALTQSQRNGL